MATNSLRGMSRLPKHDPRSRRNANRLANLADSLVGGVLSVNNDGQITLNVQSGTGLVADPNLRIDFANDPGLEVVDELNNTGLRVQDHDGLTRTSNGLEIFVQNPDSALTFDTASAGGFRLWRIHIYELQGVTTDTYPDTNLTNAGFAEWVLSNAEGNTESVGVTNLLPNNPNNIWANSNTQGNVEELVDGDLTGRASNAGWYSEWLENEGPQGNDGDPLTGDIWAAYDLGFGNAINPTWIGITGYPTANSSASYRSPKHMLLEASNDGVNWTTVWEKSDLDPFTDEELGDPTHMRWYSFAAPGGGATGKYIKVNVDPDTPIGKTSDGLTMVLGDGIETGTAGVSGTVGRWALDDGSGTIAEDDSVNGNDATLTGTFNGGGGSGWSTDFPSHLTTVSGSLDFAGTSNGVVIGQPSALDFTPGTDDWTVTAWVKHTNGSVASPGDWTTEGIVAKADDDTGQRTFYLFLDFQRMRVYVGGSEVPNQPLQTDLEDDLNLVIGDGQWHHFAVVVRQDSGTGDQLVSYYIDGLLVLDEEVHNATSTNSVDWTIGARRAGSGTNSGFDFECTNGLICDVRMYDSALDFDQITDIVNGTENGSISPIQLDLADSDSHLEFDSNGGLQVADDFVQNDGDTMTGPLTMDGTYIDLNETSAPSTPSAGTARIYQDSTSKLAKISEDGEPFAPLVGSHKLGIDTNSVTVSNTTTETDLASFTIAANRLNNDSAFRLDADLSDLDMVNNAVLTLRLYYGSTVVASVTITNNSGAAFTNYSGTVKGVLVADGATNAQKGFIRQFAGNGEFVGPSVRQTSTTGTGTGTAAEDSTTALTFKLTAQWAAANAGNSVTNPSAVVEHVQ